MSLNISLRMFDTSRYSLDLPPVQDPRESSDNLFKEIEIVIAHQRCEGRYPEDFRLASFSKMACWNKLRCITYRAIKGASSAIGEAGDV